MLTLVCKSWLHPVFLTLVEKMPKSMYQTEIQQMMFVFGEVSDPMDETSILVEEITRTQVMEIVVKAIQHSAKRGNKFLSPEDLIFLLRFDRAKGMKLLTRS